MDAATVVVLIRTYFLLTTAATVVTYTVPGLNERFLAYGARNASPSPNKRSDVDVVEDNRVSSLLDRLASITVPHSWFKHFYLVGLLLTGYWAYTVPEARNASTLLMGCHHVRRLLESLFLTRSSASRMHVTHWIMGLGFYVVLSVATWIEDYATPEQPARPWNLVGTGLFLAASTAQFSYHKHLAQLPRAPNYQLPTHAYFNYTVTPHYFLECVEYLALAIRTAREGIFNTTIYCALIFVVVNLGITAQGTRTWYEKRFGEDRISGKATMVPFIW
ncbi:hypothetical protein EJ08DRAFT_647570 [Tothia fuscella]|uniref:Polyprenal reductase n=1 Tax=Tothia fuscella TaxID=1048955 RepID=A0A9P4U044_9PEZI|nr:hypothetical protein EJ08DRAFT_647570 [Tothia fuscella]